MSTTPAPKRSTSGPLSSQSTEPMVNPFASEASSSSRKGPFISILLVSFAVLLTAMLVFVSLGATTLFPAWLTRSPHTAAASNAIPPQKIVGHVFFNSSGQIHQDSSQGIADELDLVLNNIPAPPADKTYYAWLLGDDPTEGHALMLGQLQVQNGTVHFHYAGDAQHTDLLAMNSRLLITEEDAGTPAMVPSPDTKMRLYQAAFAQTPDPQDTVHHFSLLSHLRHLLAEDPTLKSVGLPGGLDIWLFRNSQKILEWSGGARDDWPRKHAGIIHNDVVRILDYLDGLRYVQQDIPGETGTLVDNTIARIGLLEFDPQTQEPPGYLYHVGLHLHGMVQAPGATPQQQKLANKIDAALNTVQTLFERVRKDAKLLVVMNDTQILQGPALVILDDMAKAAQEAFIGQYDPITGEVQGGITQVHFAIQQLATLDVHPL